MNKNTKIVRRAVKDYFALIGNDKMVNKLKAQRMAVLRKAIDKCSNGLVMEAVRKELKHTNGSFVYKLFLENILLMERF